VDGREYHFWDPDKFERGIQAGDFLECAEVHGQRYGTLKSEVFPFIQRGQVVILDIDVQGAEQVRKRCPDAVSIFLEPPSLEVLEQRLRNRRTDTEASIQRRLANARCELARAGEYNYRVVSGDLDTTVKEVQAIIKASLGAPAPVGQ
jgi:guanylate kinase